VVTAFDRGLNVTTTKHDVIPHATKVGPEFRDCVRARSCANPPATVIELRGYIDFCDAEPVGDYLVGFVHVDHPLVLDLSGLEFLCAAGFRAIMRFAAECDLAHRHWKLLSSSAVDALLRAVPDHGFPVAESLDDALRQLADTPNTWTRLERDSMRC
jgi:anti-anti-sigma regulatory factor